MTKLKVFWYLSEALLLALYIGFFAIITNSIWIGIAFGIFGIMFTQFRTKLFDKIKVEK